MNMNILESAEKMGLIKPGTTDLIKNRQCPLCKDRINVNDFTSDLSLKEFTISGMCQKCQDKIFNEYE